MSLFETASLVITPNGIKEDKLYAIKPTDGSGDLVVTRATTATRVNSAGLIEEVPRNLLTYSQDFTNASWLKSGVTITSNTTVAPNGTTTASKIVENGSLVTYGVYKSIPLGFRYSHSIYAKKGERDWIKVNAIHGANASVWFNLANGTIGTNNSSGIPSIENIGNGWYRCVINNANHLSASSFFSVMPCTNNNVETYTGTAGNGVFIWGAQLDTGTSAKEYFPTTDRLDVPRLDYTNGSCPSILVETQRTNLCLRSNELTNAYYTTTGATIAQSSTDFLNGEKAFLFGETATTNYHRISTTGNLTATIGSTFTFSCYLKKNTGSSADIVRLRGFWGSPMANFNIVTGQILYSQICTPSIQNMGNGWFRCSITFVGSVSNNGPVNIEFINNVNSANYNYSYAGNVNATVLVAGWQYEAGAAATSYIPTTTATVTRNADVISKTGISSLIGQTEGTIYSEIRVNKLLVTASRYVFHLSDGTANNRIYIAFSGASSNILRARIFNGGTLQCSINSSTITTTGTYKLAMAYKNNDIVFYINGVQIGTDTSATIPTCSRVDIGHNYANASQFNDGINNANIWKTRLTDAECIALTTL